jgi:hypothetical protein
MILSTTISALQKACIQSMLSPHPEKTMHPNQRLNGKEEPVFCTTGHGTILSISQTKAEIRGT